MSDPQSTSHATGSPAPALAGASGHNPVLDGVRGMAILLVMWHHMTVFHAAGPVGEWYHRIAQMGVCGVDLFFVLSGFLITGILYDSKRALQGKAGGERAAGAYFKNFYARRTLRIFPLYYAVVVLALLVIPHAGAMLKGVVGPDSAAMIQGKLDKFGNIEGHEVWFWAYLSNFPMAHACSWLHQVLGVSWSLAIEEQFYLLWPGFVWFLDRKRAIRACLIIVGGALLIRTYMVIRLAGYGYQTEPRVSWINPLGIYVLTFCRFDDLGLGALVALLLRGTWTVQQATRLARVLCWVCLPGAIGLALVDVLKGWNDPRIGSTFGPLFQSAGFTLMGLACAGGLVLAISARPGGIWHGFWTNALLRTMGKYAYALYLFHLPIRAVIRDVVFGPPVAGGGGPLISFPVIVGTEMRAQMVFYVVAIGASLGAAWISWVLFESQVLKLKRFFPSGAEPVSRGGDKAAEESLGRTTDSHG